MSLVKKQRVFLILAILFALLSGCDKDPVVRSVGDNVIYMPQAAYANMRYEVPSGLDSATRNYKVVDSENKVHIILGVLRSGSQPPEEFSVQIKPLEDTASALIDNGTFPAATTSVMPASIYELPATVTVPGNKYGATFYLSVDKAKLKSYAGKKLLLGVGIEKASRFSINSKLDKVIIIVDVNGLKLN